MDKIKIPAGTQIRILKVMDEGYPFDEITFSEGSPFEVITTKDNIFDLLDIFSSQGIGPNSERYIFGYPSNTWRLPNKLEYIVMVLKGDVVWMT